MAEAGTKRVARILNIVHNDEIWKDHVRHENVSQRHKWPARWGYLVQEYHTLNRELDGKPISASSRPSSRCYGGVEVKLPQIVVPERKKSFPMTTSQQIGWQSTHKGLITDLAYKLGGDTRGKCTFTRKLNWARDSLP